MKLLSAILALLSGWQALSAGESEGKGEPSEPLARLVEIERDWGFAVFERVSANPVTTGAVDIEKGDLLVVKSVGGELVELVVVEATKEGRIIAERKRSSRAGEIEDLGMNCPVVAWRKGERSRRGNGDYLVKDLPEGAKLIGWNRPWGFKIYRLPDGREVIRQEEVGNP